MDIAELLAFSVKNKASDLHLSSGLPPMIRVDGDIRRINISALEHKEVHSLIYDIMNDKQRRDFEEFFVNYTITDEELTVFRDYIREKFSNQDVEFTDEEFKDNKDFVIRSIKQEIARALWGNEEYYRFWVRVDNEIHKSLSLFDEAQRILDLQPKTD